MSDKTSYVRGSGSFRGGVHPPGFKAQAAERPIEVAPQPQQVNIPLLQHTGAACEPAVQPKQQVRSGDVIGDAEAFISAPVHTPIAGTVGRLSVATLPNGRHVRTVPVRADGEQLTGQSLWDDIFGGDWPTDGLEKHDPTKIVQATHDAGLVGLGGAAFPTHVKLTFNEKKPIDTLLVNGCECEPYLTADYRLMLEAPAPIIVGAILAAAAVRAKRIIIAVEDNKPAAVEKMRDVAGGAGVEVAVVKTKYPAGSERQTIFTVLGRKVPVPGLPLDVGVVVLNVGTAAAVARAVLRGRPLTHRVVTVTGPGIREPKNLLVPIGISYGELIEYCGGLTLDAARVVAGGPMMGFALGSFDTPVTKGTSGVVAMTHRDIRRAGETNCIRCGRCVDACPVNLVPTKIALATRNADWDLAERYYITACNECGCCAYVCPAGIPLVQLIRAGKAQMPKE
ncbi:MAG: electron transport complex subunit RsxC [Planctomycetota bacterium]|nr:electron transport complex subunit RsxC [Planctomycetota bacterium]